MTLTAKWIDGANEPQEVRDAIVRGLVFRVNAGGSKVWEVVVSEAGRRRRVRLGLYPALSLSDARRLAAEAKGGQGIVGAQTFAALWAEYRAANSDLQSIETYTSLWRVWGEPLLGDVRVTDLNRLHAVRLVETVTAKAGRDHARRVLAFIRPCLSWAVDTGRMPSHPWAGVKVKGQATPRQRVLTREEWRALWAWAVRDGYPAGHAIRFLMTTGQRVNEAAGLAWREIDGDVWSIPPERHKQGRGHVIPLSSAAQAVLAEVPRFSPFAFVARGVQSMTMHRRLRDRISEDTGITDWQFRDVRRTAATRMAEAGVARFIIARVLGHADTAITGVYDKHSYLPELREALERLADSVVN